MKFLHGLIFIIVLLVHEVMSILQARTVSFLATICKSQLETALFSRKSAASGIPSTRNKHTIAMAFLSDSNSYAPYIPSALSATRKAARYAMYLQPQANNNPLFNNLTFAKLDASPVTIADFGVQALVLNHLNQTLPSPKSFTFVAEEGSDILRQNPALSQEILHLIQTIPGCSNKPAGYHHIQSLEELYSSIDLGKSYHPTTGKIKNPTTLLWCLDPIDGTKGFLRGKLDGGQYCIALALIENGSPVLGILVCPNLPVRATDCSFAWTDKESQENIHNSRGCIFIAIKGEGCFQLPLFPPSLETSTDDPDTSLDGAQRVHVTPNDGIRYPIQNVRFSVAVEKGFGDPFGQGIEMARFLHGQLDPNTGDILYCDRLDSQAKYGLLARGTSQVFFRLPKRESVEWIWDHAPGKIILEEAGGLQTDTYGKEINYGYGARMDPQVEGVLASCGGVIHQQLLNAYNHTKINIL